MYNCKRGFSRRRGFPQVVAYLNIFMTRDDSYYLSFYGTTTTDFDISG